jgi:hypothetical protein
MAKADTSLVPCKSILDDYPEITEDNYLYMLEVLPPIWGKKHNEWLQTLCMEYPTMACAVQCFQCSEPVDMKNGRFRYGTYAEVGYFGTSHFLFMGNLPNLSK